MSLKQIMTQLVDMEAEASINLDEVDPSIRVGAEGRWRAAREAVGQLRAQYLNEVVKSMFLIAVSGPGSEKFAEIAKEKFDTIAVDYKFLPKLLTRRLQARRCGNTYGQNEHWMMLTEIGQIKNQYDIVSLAAPTFTALSAWYQQELPTAVETLLRETYRNTLSSIVLRREIGNEALLRRFDGSKLPVILYNYDQSSLEEGVDESLLPRPMTLIRAEEYINEFDVKEQLLKVRDQLGGGKRKKMPQKENLATQESQEAEGQESEDADE